MSESEKNFEREYNFYHAQANGVFFGSQEPITLNIKEDQEINFSNHFLNSTIVLANFPSYELAMHCFRLMNSSEEKK